MDAQFGGRQSPIRNTLKLKANEYREYLSQYGFSAYQMQNWLNNDVFKGGVKLPYTPDEFITKFAFSDKSAHIMFEVEQNMEALLEEKLW
tara:strand:- start:73 stop:342 length:270 start_codon:yes stop_codon:yes gene_type:complete